MSRNRKRNRDKAKLKDKVSKAKLCQASKGFLLSSNRNRNHKVNLRSKMISQLRGSRFRYINSLLYENDSKAAYDFFKKDPEAFQLYHDDFKQQASQWDTVPVNKVISFIKERYNKLDKSKNMSMSVADFGCGEALIAKELVGKNIRVHSFDFIALNDRVTACDMANTKLFSSSIDIAVFCLSLMGTNCKIFIKEARRVLRLGGLMIIAEVQSRIEDMQKFVQAMQQFGFEEESTSDLQDIFVLFLFKKVSEKKIKRLPDIPLLPSPYKKR